MTECLKHQFWHFYLAQQTGEAFQAIYSNVNHAQDAFVGFWDVVSKYFQNTSGVLAYELLNEPWVGDIFHQPRLLEPKEADRKNLQPLYDRLNSVIRSNDPDRIIMFEPAVIISQFFESGLHHSPGGETFNNRSILSYHVYCADFNSTGPKSRAVCDALDEEAMLVRMKDLGRLKCGGFLSEFGAMSNDTSAEEEITYVTSLADEYIQSWTYWQFKTYNDITTQAYTGNVSAESFYAEDGSLEMNKVKALSRTYAPAIAGTPTWHFFNAHNAMFELHYKANKVCYKMHRCY